MSEVINKHSRMPRKLSRLTLRRREQQAIIGGPYKLAEVDPKSVISRYLAGERIVDIAAQYGVSRIGMYHFLLRLVPDEWLDAQKARAFAMKEEGEEMALDAQDPLQLAKGREVGKFGQWDLERVDRKNYGKDTQDININITDLGDRLRRARERVIEGQTLSIQQSQGIEHKDHRAASIDTRAQGEKVAA